MLFLASKKIRMVKINPLQVLPPNTKILSSKISDSPPLGGIRRLLMLLRKPCVCPKRGNIGENFLILIMCTYCAFLS